MPLLPSGTPHCGSPPPCDAAPSVHTMLEVRFQGTSQVSPVSPVAGGDLTSLCLPCSFILRCELGETNCRVECLTSDSGFRCLRACLALKLLILVYVLFLSNVRVGRRSANLHWVWVGWFCSGLLPGQGLTPACSSVLMVELMESKLYWACVFFSLC